MTEVIAEIEINAYNSLCDLDNSIEMKSYREKLKIVAKLLSLLILVQSCTIYRSSSASLDEAIDSSNDVKLYTEHDEPFKFEKLERINGEVYGLVRIKSSTYKWLKSRDSIQNEYKSTTYVKLYDNELNDIYLKNKTASTLVSILIPVVVVFGIVLIVNNQAYVGDFL